MPTILRRTWSHGVLLAVGAAALYWISALVTHHGATPGTAYFNELARAFLHGRLHLIDPRSTLDLTLYSGRAYVPFPPLPAILMVPFVAVLGLAHLNTVLFASALGGINVALVHRLLATMDRVAIVRTSPSTRRWLVATYGIGSVHWYMATQGSVWFLAHVAAAAFVLGAMCLATDGHAIAAGVTMGVAALGRPTTLLMAPVVLGLLFTRSEMGRHERIRLTARVLTPAAAIAALLLAYNRARFGRFTEFGYRNEQVAPQLQSDLDRYGQFNVHFVAHDVWAMFLAGPRWVAESSRLAPDPDGMSMFLTTPAIVYASHASRRVRLTSWSWAAIALMLVPLLTYYNTGWYQFGARFSLDFLPAIVVLMAIGIGERITTMAKVLVIAGIAVNAWGLNWFN